MPHNNLVLTQNEVCTGNITETEALLYIDQAIATDVNASRLKFDIPVKTERSRFPKTTE